MCLNKKLFLKSISSNDDKSKIAIVSYLRENFVDRSIVITLDDNKIISHIYFQSRKYGSAEWINGNGLEDCRRWESEDEARSITYLTRRYTTVLSDGPVGIQHTLSTLLPDIFEHIDDRDLVKTLNLLVKLKKYEKPFIIEKYSIFKDYEAKMLQAP